MNRTGFTLVELLVIITITGILLAIGSLNFSVLQRKSQIERQTRELYTDINTARAESIYRKKLHRFTFEPGSYSYKRYSSENEAASAGTTILSRTVSNQLTKEGGQDISGYSVEFDIRGFATGITYLTLRINPVDSGAAFDCIIIHAARTNMGKMENGTCVFK